MNSRNYNWRKYIRSDKVRYRCRTERTNKKRLWLRDSLGRKKRLIPHVFWMKSILTTIPWCWFLQIWEKKEIEVDDFHLQGCLGARHALSRSDKVLSSKMMNAAKYNTHNLMGMTVIINTYRSCLLCGKRISASESLCEECMSKYKIKKQNYDNDGCGCDG